MRYRMILHNNANGVQHIPHYIAYCLAHPDPNGLQRNIHASWSLSKVAGRVMLATSPEEKQDMYVVSIYYLTLV